MKWTWKHWFRDEKEAPKPPRELIALVFAEKPKCECCERKVSVVARVPLPQGERYMRLPVKVTYVATSVQLCHDCARATALAFLGEKDAD